MTVRLLVGYEMPADPEAFDRHYDRVHITLGRRLPGLAATRSAARCRVRGFPRVPLAADPPGRR